MRLRLAGRQASQYRLQPRPNRACIQGKGMNKKIIFCGSAPLVGSWLPDASPSPKRVFLLSPADMKGVRGRQLLNPNSEFELAQRLQAGQATLGECFSFISSLYFRGKLAYAETFATPPEPLSKSYVITGSLGLLTPQTKVDLAVLRELSESKIDADEPAYRIRLERDAIVLSEALGERGQVVLLGSIATDKYVVPLSGIFGNRLLFPLTFVGRGDMSRGGLLLRSAREHTELRYARVAERTRKTARRPRSFRDEHR